ncbi:MAG TPA: DUF393 domain-containing protein [Blastocatellia bacterium]|nr:DUF393 domain-containing protein [Blastocatellia bacterium]
MAQDRKSLLLYDGTCRLCEAGSRKALRLAGPGAIERADVNDPEIRGRFQISREAAQREMYFINARGELSHGAGAVRELLRLNRWARPAAWLWRIPGFAPLAQKAYLWFAAHRYMFMGRMEEGGAEACEGGACAIHLGKPGDSKDH